MKLKDDEVARVIAGCRDFKMTDAREHWETTRGLELLDGLPWIGMKTVDDKFVPWLASQTDVLSEDWGVVE